MSDNEEALFDDIYADDVPEKVEEKPVEVSPEIKKDSEEEETEETTKNEEISQNIEEENTTNETNDTNITHEEETNKRRADLTGEGGKMFIGGLDWDTDEDRLKEYFSQYGEVIEHTIMREASTGRSRGFGFLTFADKKSVQEVLKTQHVLDGKVIDPKRSIPRDEQDKTGKIFVGGIAPEVRPHEYEAFFSQFGTIIDAQLMLDKDTGKSRGFGFVTFDSPEAVDKVCKGKYLDFNGRQVEVKRAEPRGPQQQQNHIAAQQQRYLQQGYGRRNQGQQFPGVTPEAMNEYYKNMAQYWTTLQQQGGQAAQFAQYAQQLQEGSVPPPPPPSGSSSSASSAPPINAPRGPARGNYRGRGRGNYRHNYHPYQR